jgi:hypothetical protein
VNLLSGPKPLNKESDTGHTNPSQGANYLLPVAGALKSLTYLRMAETSDQMIVHDTSRLHERVADG